MKNAIIILIISIFIACGIFHKNKPKNPIEIMKGGLDNLSAQLRSELTVKNGWIGRDCDGLLFNSLAYISGVKLNLFLAEYKSGKWHRRPAPPCFDGKDRGSKSTTSNDMLSGLLAAIWATKDLDAANRLYDFGKSRDWVMGDPYPQQIARVVLRPNGRYLLARIIQNISGVKKEELILPNLYLGAKKDFERHLETIGIFLSGDLNNLIDGQMINRLKDNVRSNPRDALFNAVLGIYQDGNLITAMNLVLDPNYQCPSYVRGADEYCSIHKLFVIYVINKGIE